MEKENRRNVFHFDKYTSTIVEANVFKEFNEQKNLKLFSEQEKVSHQFKLFSGMISDGYLNDLKSQTAIYIYLIAKTTMAFDDSTKQIWYLVYGGKFTDIINELGRYFGIKKDGIFYHLDVLQEKKYLQYKTKKGVGTFIALRRIRGVYERKEFDKKLTNETFEKAGLTNEKTGDTQLLNEQQRRATLQKEPTNDSYKDSYKDKTTTTDKAVMLIFELFQATNKGFLSLSKIKDEVVKNGDLEMSMRRAIYASNHAQSNVPAYWLKLMEQDAMIIKEEPELPSWATEKGQTVLPDAYLPLHLRKKCFETFGDKKGYKVVIEIIESFHLAEKYHNYQEITPKEIEGIEEYIKFVKNEGDAHKFIKFPGEI